ncbi:TatD family hydrolase [Candidatus Beckwithbacteria bacterium]|nr:TatD family hydrolase [Candidatus Beckwithbacteria bacterium]
MNLIDSHCHLHILSDIEEKIKKALKNGIKKIIIPATNYDDALAIMKLTDKYANLFFSVGIFPNEIDKIADLELERTKIEALLKQKNNKLIGIGECGLDFENIDKNGEKKQIQLFKQHLLWAEKYKLPLIIHTKGTGKIALEIIEELKLSDLKLVFHCFTGSKKLAQKILTFPNFYFGIGGILTFDPSLQEVVKIIPIQKIILETDSPYLTPKPVKDQNPWPNEPANLIYTAEKLSQIKQLDLEKTAKITTSNSRYLFSLPKLKIS